MSLSRLNRRHFILARKSQVALENEEPATPAQDQTPPAEEVPAVEPEASAAEVPAEVPAEQAPAAAEEVPPAEQAPAAAAPAEEQPAAEPVEEMPTRSSVDEMIRRAQERAAAQQTGETPADQQEEAPAADPAVAEVQAEGAPAAAEEPAAVEQPPVEQAPVASEEVPPTDAVPPVEASTSEEAPAVAEEDLVVIDSEGDEAEALLNEAGQHEELVSELDAEMDQAEDVHGDFNKIADVVEAAAENGGLSTDGAQLLQIATESLYRSLGMQKPIGIPALESFTTVSARVSGAALALEALKDTTKQIWEKLVEGFKKLMEWVQEFGKRVIDANARTKARAEKILEAAKKLDASKSPKSEVVGSNTLFAALAINGQAVRDPAKYVKYVVDFAANAFGPRAQESIKQVDTMVQVLEAIKKGVVGKENLSEYSQKLVDASAKAIDDVVNSGMKEYGGPAADFDLEEAPEGMKLVSSPVFIGDKILWAYVPNSDEMDVYKKLATAAGFKTGLAHRQAKVDDKAQLHTLAPADIVKLAEVALHYTQVAEGYKATLESVRKMNNIFANVSSVFAGLADNEARQGDGEHRIKAAMKAGMNTARLVRAFAKGIHQPAFSLAAGTVAASLEYAALSLRAYNAPVKEKAGSEFPALA